MRCGRGPPVSQPTNSATGSISTTSGWITTTGPSASAVAFSRNPKKSPNTAASQRGSRSSRSRLWALSSPSLCDSRCWKTMQVP